MNQETTNQIEATAELIIVSFVAPLSSQDEKAYSYLLQEEDNNTKEVQDEQ